jgi:hypothetical protein
MPEEHQFAGTPLNPLLEQINYQGKTITSLDDDWEFNSFRIENDNEEK